VAGEGNGIKRNLANMKGGGKEPFAIPVFEDGRVLTKKYLHDLEDAVRARTPIAGVGINLIRTSIGTNIAFNNSTTCQILDFNVCSNGLPDKIAIVAVVTKSNFAYDKDIPLSYAPISTSSA
jgi:hypothetical protein